MNHVALLETNVHKFPDKDCIRFNGKGYTYRDIQENVSACRIREFSEKRGKYKKAIA